VKAAIAKPVEMDARAWFVEEYLLKPSENIDVLIDLVGGEPTALRS
jgi:hypothetical protein